jgi:hypothetical protein
VPTACVIRAMRLSALIMEAVRTSETSFYENTWPYIPEGSHIHTRRHETLKSYSMGRKRYGLNVTILTKLINLLSDVI